MKLLVACHSAERSSGPTDWRCFPWPRRNQCRPTRVGLLPGRMPEQGKEIRRGTKPEGCCSTTNNCTATAGEIFEW